MNPGFLIIRSLRPFDGSFCRRRPDYIQFWSKFYLGGKFLEGEVHKYGGECLFMTRRFLQGGFHDCGGWREGKDGMKICAQTVPVILSFGPPCGVALVSDTLPKRRCENQRDLSGKSGTFGDFSGLLRIHRWKTKKGLQVIDFLATPRYFKWRRHPDLNRGIAVLQTAALPLGYAAIKIGAGNGI